MPNFCGNVLIVRGDPKELKRFINSVKGTSEGEALDFDFNTLVPCPRDLLEDDTCHHEEYYYAWYGTCEEISNTLGIQLFYFASP